MTGQAFVHMQQGRVPDALRAHAEEFAERATFATLGNPIDLASQTQAWVTKAKELYPTAHADWVRAVQQRMRVFSMEIAHSVATACHRPTQQTHHPVLKYSGQADIIYVDRCPLCNAENVRINRADPATFRPPRLFSRILAARVCDHHLPISTGLWQAMLNASTLIREGDIETY